MPEPRPPFYPPRAPWYSPVREAGLAALSATRIQRLPTPGQIGPGRFLLGLILPGYAFLLHRRPKIGLALMLIWPLIFTLGLAFLGQAPGNVLLGLAISLHATSLVHLLGPWLKDITLGYRIASAGVAVGGLVVFFYLPLQEFAHYRYFRPILTHQGVVIVHPTRNPKTVRRGDWIVYHQERSNMGQVIVQEGTSFGPVLGGPGDTIEFTPSVVRVNGKPQPRQEGMPTAGSVTVDQDRWFVWPRLSHAQRGNVDDDTIRAAIFARAEVPFERLRGRPFARWFHRRQILETP